MGSILFAGVAQPGLYHLFLRAPAAIMSREQRRVARVGEPKASIWGFTTNGTRLCGLFHECVDTPCPPGRCCWGAQGRSIFSHSKTCGRGCKGRKCLCFITRRDVVAPVAWHKVLLGTSARHPTLYYYCPKTSLQPRSFD